MLPRANNNGGPHANNGFLSLQPHPSLCMYHLYHVPGWESRLGFRIVSAPNTWTSNLPFAKFVVCTTDVPMQTDDTV